MNLSPDVDFIFHTVGFILSGLAIAVIAWLVWRTRDFREWLERVPPFALFAASHGLGAWGSFGLLFDEAILEQSPALFFDGSHIFETAGLAALGHIVLRTRQASLLWLAPLVEIVSLFSGAPWVHPLVVVGLSGAVFTAMFRAHRVEARFEWLGMLLMGTAHVTVLLTTAPPSIGSWTVLSALRLLALVAFTLAIERRSGDLFVQVFVRLNLTFIFLAGILMLMASQAERSRRLDYARREVEDLAEFLRGHVIYYLQDGSSASDVLESPIILREAVAEFGHYPDLRSIRVSVRDLELRVSIDNEGMIAQELVSLSNVEPVGESASLITVAHVPIFLEGETIGAVVLEETARSVNRDMAQSILVIFAVFTSAVTIGSFIVGAIVYRASETIREQVDQIESSERRIIQAAKLASVGELVSGVAHEINNPLGVIVSRAEYLLEEIGEADGASELAEDLRVIDGQAQRISKIVQQLLEFARPHSIQFSAVSLEQIVEPVRRLVDARLRQSGIRFEEDIPDDLPALRGDRDRLEQVLLNLINNAADAMPDGGEIRLRAESKDSKVLVMVSDTGTGIDEEDLERIFDPFFSKKDGKGTGLGLSVSYGIIRDHHGEIWAESTPGTGSTFHILLPSEASR